MRGTKQDPRKGKSPGGVAAGATRQQGSLASTCWIWRGGSHWRPGKRLVRNAGPGRRGQVAVKVAWEGGAWLVQVPARQAAIQTSTPLRGLPSLTDLLTAGKRDRRSSAEEGMRCSDLSALEGLWDVWALSLRNAPHLLVVLTFRGAETLTRRPGHSTDTPFPLQAHSTCSQARFVSSAPRSLPHGFLWDRLNLWF